MTITKIKNGELVEQWQTYKIDDVHEMAKICLHSLNLHPSVSGTVLGNNHNCTLIVDAGDFYRFEIEQ